jgi:hypothetical protein
MRASVGLGKVIWRSALGGENRRYALPTHLSADEIRHILARSCIACWIIPGRRQCPWAAGAAWRR